MLQQYRKRHKTGSQTAGGRSPMMSPEKDRIYDLSTDKRQPREEVSDTWNVHQGAGKFIREADYSMKPSQYRESKLKASNRTWDMCI